MALVASVLCNSTKLLQRSGRVTMPGFQGRKRLPRELRQLVPYSNHVSDRRLPVRAVFPNNKIGGFLRILPSRYQSGVVCSVARLEDFPSAVMRSPTGTAGIFRTGCWGAGDDLFRREAT
jgi:hypothetical protein